MRNTDNNNSFKFSILKKTFCVSSVEQKTTSPFLRYFSSKQNVDDPGLIVFSAVIGTECFIIRVGNTFTIFVFWNHCSSSLRRTCYLLLNLAVVDLLVSVAEPKAFAAKIIPYLLERNRVMLLKATSASFLRPLLSCFQLLQLFLSPLFHWNALGLASASCICFQR